jgi:hypothetical protein
LIFQSREVFSVQFSVFREERRAIPPTESLLRIAESGTVSSPTGGKMGLYDIARQVLPGAASIVMTPLVLRFLSRMAPPRGAALARGRGLSGKFRRLEIASQVACMMGVFAGIGAAWATGKNSPYLLGLLFGGMIAAPMVLVAVCTLPRGRSEWEGFWLYYEWKYGLSLRFIFPLYALMIGAGIWSAIALFI